jgi:hypothetical protein
MSSSGAPRGAPLSVWTSKKHLRGCVGHLDFSADL